MKKITKTLAGALALATVITTFAGCSGSASGGEAGTSAGETKQTLADNSNVQGGAAELASNVGDEYQNIKVDTKIKWMAWWDIQEASPAVELFKQLYGTPENCPEGYEDTPAENVFVNISVATYADRYTTLATRIQSGDSPDCFPFEIQNYPYSIYQNLFQNVDDLFNFEDEEWAAYKNVIDKFEWNGKNYCPVMDLSVSDVLWYRTSVIDDAGLDDPWQLYEDGEWTWETFLEMCREFTDIENGKWAIDGYNPENSFVATTGSPIIGIEGGKLVSNLNNANIEKCMEMLQLFDDEQEQLRYPREIENGWSPSMPEWVNGNVLFYADGTYRYEEHWHKYKAKNEWEDDEISFVPYPKMDGSDEYYQLMKQDAIMLCAGSKNVDGYKAWIYANLLASQDTKISEAAREQSKENYDWTDELLDRLDLITAPDNFSPVFDFKNGIGEDIAGTSTKDTPVEQLTKYPYMDNQTYTSVRASVQGQIEARIDEINAHFGLA